ncbi:MAG: hydantoinase/oxoprolinase N-terminal domain-containing protein, partial [Pseudomonadota bacterium]|nr:hydantoinase/oxoprolinase N-terminal domain-containing protein [Pseudomonadota bacterium]
MEAARWLFAGDRGGTFTDVIGLDPAGTVRTEKLLSVSDHYPDALIEGIRRLLGLNPGGALPEARIGTIRIGTTVATNALLERRAAPTGLLITRGFGDLLEIGHQARPRLFDLDIVKPRQLYSAVAEVPERVAADGTVLEPLDSTAVTAALRRFREQGIESLAVALLHGWLNPDH